MDRWKLYVKFAMLGNINQALEKHHVFRVYPANLNPMQVKLNVSIVLQIHFQNHLVHHLVLRVQRKEQPSMEVFNVQFVEKVRRKLPTKLIRICTRVQRAMLDTGQTVIR